LKYLLKKFIKIVPGLFIFAIGILLNGRSELGYAPWNVLTDGVARVFGVTFGLSSIGIGVVIIIISVAMREQLGVGTVLNMLLIGGFVDLLAWMDSYIGFVPQVTSFAGRLVMCLLSLVFSAIGTCIYMSIQWGAGPRDSLVVAIARKSPLPYGACRAIVEGLVFAAGWIMGGAVGIGSVINVVLMGPMTGLIFRIMHIDVKRFKNEDFADTWRILRKQSTVSE